MDKKITLFLGLSILLFSCKDEYEEPEKCTLPDLIYGSSQEWFTGLENWGDVNAISKDSLGELFQTYMYNSQRGNYQICPREFEFERYVAYHPSITQDEMAVTVENDKEEIICYLTVRNSKTGSTWKFHSGKPGILSNHYQDFPGCVSFIKDTLIRGISYADVYRITPPSVINGGPLKFMLLCKSKGILECEIEGSFHWYFKP